LRAVQQRKAPVIVVAFAIITTGLLVFVSAAVSTSSVETESGQITPPAATLSDATASNNSAVQFGNGGFVHPGILVNKQQLDFVKAKIENGDQPWRQAYETASGGSLGNTTRPPSAVPEVKCTDSRYLPPNTPTYPAVGCEQLRDDANAAYTRALLWYYTGEKRFADSAIGIINAWATTHKKTWFDQPRMVNGQVVYGQPGDNSNCPSSNPCYQVYSNGLLFNAWAAQSMTRAAEILRYSNSGWSQQDIQKAETYFKTVHMDALGAGWVSTSNWETSVAEAWVNIGIFTNDREIFNKGIAYWRQETPRYMYMQSDGALPLNPYKKIVWVTGANGIKYPTSQITPSATEAEIKKTWDYPNRFITGLSKETCRDIGHNYMGFGGIANVAETARIQGIDLYSEQKDRIIAAYELNAGYSNEVLDQLDAQGKAFNAVNLDAMDQAKTGWFPKNNWHCPDFDTGGGSLLLGQEIAYNHYAKRLGISMPQTQRLVERKGVRPSKAGNHMVWETLTHAGTP
jgi:hypothetical protein